MNDGASEFITTHPFDADGALTSEDLDRQLAGWVESNRRANILAGRALKPEQNFHERKAERRLANLAQVRVKPGIRSRLGGLAG